MVNLVLLGGKVVFLLLLYLFIYMVVRSAGRDMKSSAARSIATQSGATAPVAVAPGPVTLGGGAAEGVRRPSAGVAGPDAGAWALVVEQSPHAREGWAFVIPPGAQMIAGRAPDTDIHLPDTFVSSHHARVEARTNGVVVEDLDSTNGTFVNGEEIAGAVLMGPGDTLAVGDSTFRVEARG